METKKITSVELKGRSILLLDYYSSEQELKDCLSENHFLLVKQQELELKLIETFVNFNFDKQKTLVVFVGQSSLELKHRIEKLIPDIFTGYQTQYVHAQRIYESITLKGRETYSVKATVGQIDIPLLPAHRYKEIIVFDDVISSGITLKTLRDRNTSKFLNTSWKAFVLLSKQEKIKGYETILAPVFVENQLASVNTFSKLVEDEKIRREYLNKYFSNTDYVKVNNFLDQLKKDCIHSPHVFCFDLYNTLIYEKTNNCLVNFCSGESEQAIEMDIPSYLDYFVEQYGEKYLLTKEKVYAFVRDRLMTSQQESFEEMTRMLFSDFVPTEPCTTRKAYSTANLVEWYWRVGSASARWINDSFPKKLERLKNLGHKVVLITNCTFPAWKKVSPLVEKYFDLCLVSSIEGISKPSESIFEIAENAFPEYTRNKFVMIGDNPQDDLAIPKQRGWEVYNEDFLHQFVL